VVIPYINNWHLTLLLRSKYLIPAVGFNVIKGLPLRAEEIEERIESLLGR